MSISSEIYSIDPEEALRAVNTFNYCDRQTLDKLPNKPATIDVSIYDNSETVKYRWAYALRTPSKLLIMQQGDELIALDDADPKLTDISEWQFISAFSFAQEMLATNSTINSSIHGAINSQKIYQHLLNYLGNEYDSLMITLIVVNNYQPDKMLDVLNIMAEEIEKSRLSITDLDTFRTVCTNWSNEMIELLRREINDFIYYQRIFNTLEEQGNYPISNVLIDKAKIHSNPTTYQDNTDKNNKIPLNSSNAIVYFDRLACSSALPYVQYNHRNDSNARIIHKRKRIAGTSYKVVAFEFDAFTKIFAGDPAQKSPHYDKIIPASQDVAKADHIYSVVWLGKGANKVTKESHILLDHDLYQNNLTFITEIRADRQINDIIKKINEHLLLDLGDYQLSNIHATLNIYGLEYDIQSFAHMILNDEFMNRYLHIIEANSAVAERQMFDFHYGAYTADENNESNNASNIVFALKQFRIQHNVSYHLSSSAGINMIYNGSEKTSDYTNANMPNDTPYVQMIIKKARSQRSLQRGLRVILRLLWYYQSERQNILNLLRTFVPGLDELRAYHLNSILQRSAKSITNKVIVGEEINMQAGPGPAYYDIKTLHEQYGDNYLFTAPEFTQNFTVEQLQTIQQKMPDVNHLPLTRSIIEEMLSSRIKRLQKFAPHVFLKGEYSRIFQNVVQPTIIYYDEIKVFESFAIRVLSFPRNDPIYYLISTHKQNRYMSVSINRMSNKNIYEYVPRASHNDAMAPGAGGYYHEYYHDRVRRATNQNYVKRTNKILGSNRLGILPNMVSEIIKINLAITDVNYQINRMGVSSNINYSKNSLLHCILSALSASFNQLSHLPDDTYRQFLQESINIYSRLEDDEVKEELVRRVRLAMANSEYIKAECLQQEMYDYSLRDIRHMLGDSNYYLDPRLYYRALEEIFNINILVFYVPDVSEDNREPCIEIPRHRAFHIFNIQANRPTVLIFKHWGADSDQTEFPVCELIVTQLNNQLHEKIYQGRITDMAYTLKLNTYTTYTFSYNNSCVSTEPEKNCQAANNILTRKNYYNMTALAQLFFQADKPYRAEYQYIDIYGKMRGVLLNYNNKHISIFFTASAPLNLPVVEGLTRVSHTLAVELFGSPSAIDRLQTKSGLKIIGLWFAAADLAYGVYVPVQPIEDVYNDLPLGPSNPFYSERKLQVANNINILHKAANILIQLLIWLFDIYQLEESLRLNADSEFIISPLPIEVIEDASVESSESEKCDQLMSNDPIFLQAHPKYYEKVIDSFLQQYVVFDQDGTNDKDNLQLYNINNIPALLPEYDQVVAGLEYIGQYRAEIIRNNRFYLNSQILYQKVRYRLIQHLRTTDGMERKPANIINGLYKDISDFAKQPQTILFLSDEEFVTWVDRLADNSMHPTDITNEITYVHMNMKIPYTYQDTFSQKIYLIQNVERGLAMAAYNVAYKWHYEKINTGYHTTAQAVDKPIYYVVYSISAGRSLTVVDDKSDGQHNYLQILRYNNNNHAAILPLL